MVEILLGIVIALLIVVIIALIAVMMHIKKKDNTEIKELDGDKINATVSSVVSKSLIDITNQFNVLKDNLNDEISKANKLITENLATNSNENKQHLAKVTESLTKISESSKNLEELNKQIDDLKQVLNVNQLTGRYGEEILENIIAQVFGETHGLYEFQKTLSNGKKPDAVVNFPAPINKVCIDSKFNFVEYNNLFFSEDEASKKEYKARFKAALREEIDKISKDYFIKDETSEFVLLFMPNDSIFNFVQNDDDLYENIYMYAKKKNVILTSPSSLQPILMTMNVIRINVKTKENIDNILKSLRTFETDVKRLDERFQKVVNNLNTISNSIDDCSKSVKKVVKRTDELVEYGELEEEKEI